MKEPENFNEAIEKANDNHIKIVQYLVDNPQISLPENTDVNKLADAIFDSFKEGAMNNERAK